MGRKQEFVDPPDDRASGGAEPLLRLVGALLTGAVLCLLGALVV